MYLSRTPHLTPISYEQHRIPLKETAVKQVLTSFAMRRGAQALEMSLHVLSMNGVRFSPEEIAELVQTGEEVMMYEVVDRIPESPATSNAATNTKCSRSSRGLRCKELPVEHLGDVKGVFKRK